MALQADDGTANSETFEYFLACPAGAVRVASKTSSARWPTRIHSLINCVCVADQVSPFAADLASLGTSLPDAADQAALVTAASGAGAEAQALVETIAAPGTTFQLAELTFSCRSSRTRTTTSTSTLHAIWTTATQTTARCEECMCRLSSSTARHWPVRPYRRLGCGSGRALRLHQRRAGRQIRCRCCSSCSQTVQMPDQLFESKTIKVRTGCSR